MTKMVVAIAGSALLLSTSLIGLLAALSRPIPDVLPTLAVASLTGLLGVLSPRSGPQEDR